MNDSVVIAGAPPFMFVSSLSVVLLFLVVSSAPVITIATIRRRLSRLQAALWILSLIGLLGLAMPELVRLAGRDAIEYWTFWSIWLLVLSTALSLLAVKRRVEAPGHVSGIHPPPTEGSAGS